jgi:hypothetical protein
MCTSKTFFSGVRPCHSSTTISATCELEVIPLQLHFPSQNGVSACLCHSALEQFFGRLQISKQSTSSPVLISCPLPPKSHTPAFYAVSVVSCTSCLALPKHLRVMLPNASIRKAAFFNEKMCRPVMDTYTHTQVDPKACTPPPPPTHTHITHVSLYACMVVPCACTIAVTDNWNGRGPQAHSRS